MLIKQIGLLKRKPGMTPAQFRRYYENSHRVIGEKYLAGYATRYARRFLNPLTTSAELQEFDVILEIWYPDHASYDRCREHLSTPAVAAEIAADEEQLFDRSANRFFLVEEHESSLPSV